jgi:hypothetical protein
MVLHNVPNGLQNSECMTYSLCGPGDRHCLRVVRTTQLAMHEATHNRLALLKSGDCLPVTLAR